MRAKRGRIYAKGLNRMMGSLATAWSARTIKRGRQEFREEYMKLTCLAVCTMPMHSSYLPSCSSFKHRLDSYAQCCIGLFVVIAVVAVLRLQRAIANGVTGFLPLHNPETGSALTVSEPVLAISNVLPGRSEFSLGTWDPVWFSRTVVE